MDKKWHTEIAKVHGWHGAMAGFVFPSDLLPDKLKTAEYGQLFAYMYRRFGVPEYGSDDYKEIANWYITTPNENVALLVSPRPSGIKYSFGYMINKNTSVNRNECEQALIAAMKDLLCPVFVRDVPINAVGKMDDIGDDEVPAFKWAGYGVPHKFFEEEYNESS